MAAPPAKISNPQPEAEDDEIEASRAPLLDHLLELRGRLIWCMVGILVGFIISFVFASQIYLFLVEPFSQASIAVRGASQPLELIFTGPFEFFFAKVKLALFGGIILAFPVIAYQVYAFIAPGLYKRERATVLPYLIASPVLFIAGSALVYYFVLPFAMRFALGQEVNIDGDSQISVELMTRVSEYLSLVTTLILAFGFAFQMPVVLSLAGRAGLISAQALRKGRRYAIVGIFVFAAIVTPPDPFSQIILGLAIMALYELSIFAVLLVEKKRAKTEAEDAAAEAAG